MDSHLDKRYAVENCIGIQDSIININIEGKTTARVIKIYFDSSDKYNRDARLLVKKDSFDGMDEYEQRTKKILFLALMAYPDFFTGDDNE